MNRTCRATRWLFASSILAASGLIIWGMLAMLALPAAQASAGPGLGGSSKTVSPAGPAPAGGLLTYTIRLFNDGDTNETLWLVDGIPRYTTYLSRSLTGPAEYRRLIGTLGADGIFWSGVLTAHSAITISFQVRVTDSIPGGAPGALSVTNTVRAYQGETEVFSDTVQTDAVAPPQVSITATPTKTFIGALVHFSGTTDQNSFIQQWLWDFDDGSTYTGPVVSHAFLQTGTFNVRLAVTNVVGLGNLDTETIQVSPSHLCLPLVLLDRNYCPPDAYEPNNTFEQARLLSPPQIIQAHFCPDDADDFFKIEITQPGTVSLDLTMPEQTDLDLYLYSSPETIVAASNISGRGVAEHIEYRASSAGLYYIRVYPFLKGPDAIQPYTLSVR